VLDKKRLILTAFAPPLSQASPMKIDRRVPLSAAAYQAALDRAGELSLSEFVNTVLIQVLQPITLPVSVATDRQPPEDTSSFNS